MQGIGSAGLSVANLASGPLSAQAKPPLAHGKAPEAAGEGAELRKQFDSFVGETFYGQLLGAMRKTVDKPAYFNGGRAEEAFRGQLDQMLATKMAEASADQFSGPMFELFNLNRS